MIDGENDLKKTQNDAERKEDATRAESMGSVTEAERTRVANNMEAHQAVKAAEKKVAAANREYSATEQRWNQLVEAGKAVPLKALSDKREAMKKNIQVQQNALTLAIRQREDTADQGMMALTDARLRAQKETEQRLEANRAAIAAKDSEVNFSEKDAEAAENEVAKSKPKPPAAWRKMYNSVIKKARTSDEDAEEASKAAFNPQTIRAEKFARIRARADMMTAKMKEQWGAPKEDSTPSSNADELANQATAKNYAKEAEEHALAASQAAQKVTSLESQLSIAGDSPIAASLRAQVAQAKSDERVARKKADESLSNARQAAAAAGIEGQRVEAKSEARAKQEKLKAEQAAAEDELERQAAKAAAAAAEAKKKAALAAVNAGGKVKEESVVVRDAEAEKAAAVKAAAGELEHVGIENHPEVRAIHSKSVTQVAKDTFKELIGGGHMDKTFGGGQKEVSELSD